jgi:hypothetical protein
MNRLANYAKLARVIHAIYGVTSYHDYKIVNASKNFSTSTITSSHVLRLSSENKPHPCPRVLRRLESIVTLRGKITRQYDTCEPREQREWLPQSGRVLPHRSAIFHSKTSPGNPWVARTLSLLIIHEVR